MLYIYADVRLADVKRKSNSSSYFWVGCVRKCWPDDPAVDIRRIRQQEHRA